MKKIGTSAVINEDKSGLIINRPLSKLNYNKTHNNFLRTSICSDSNNLKVSPSTPLNMIYCKICRVYCYKQNIQLHIQGKTHQKNMNLKGIIFQIYIHTIEV